MKETDPERGQFDAERGPANRDPKVTTAIPVSVSQKLMPPPGPRGRWRGPHPVAGGA